MYFYFGRINIQRHLQKIFKFWCTLFSIDMAASKYCKFGYASMCGNIKTMCVTTNPVLVCALRSPTHFIKLFIPLESNRGGARVG